MQRQSAIEEEYSNAESLHIAIASANGLQFLNGTVHSFGLAVVAPHAESIDDALLMTVEHFDDLGYLWDIGSQRTLTPHHVKRKRLSPVQLAFDDITEVLLDAPCTGHLVVCIDDCVKLYLLLVCESGGILQEEVSRPLEVFVGLHFPSAHGINSLTASLKGSHMSILAVSTFARWIGFKALQISAFASSFFLPPTTSSTVPSSS